MLRSIAAGSSDMECLAGTFLRGGADATLASWLTPDNTVAALLVLPFAVIQ